MPTALCEMEGYWCYWHGGKGYSGVAMWVNKDFIADRPAFAHPAFDYENRIVTLDVHPVRAYPTPTREQVRDALVAELVKLDGPPR